MWPSAPPARARALALALAIVAWGLGAAPARAAELTDVASSFDAGNRFDFRFRMRYEHTERRARLKRELEGLSPDQGTVEVLKDLAFSQHRDAVALRAEVGLYHDLMLHVELPIVIEEATTYAFDQAAGTACVFPPAASPTCVDTSNSSTVADGLVPAAGFDARGQFQALEAPHVFRGPRRGARGGAGLDAFDTINLGLTWAPLSQARDRSKPTWTILVEGQFSFGNVKAFDRAAPDANHGVSEGTHRLFLRTALSRRFRHVEPYWALWYLLPIPRSDSLFIDYGPAQKTKNPQQQAGVTAGLEIVPYERADKAYKLAVDLRGRAEAHFVGRGYSEAFELLGGAPGLECSQGTAAYNRACDPASPANPYQNRAFTGVTTIDNFLTLGLEVALLAQVSPWMRLRTAFAWAHDQAHLITGDDVGTPSKPGGRVLQASEFNPAFRPLIDQVGRRYVVDDSDTYSVYLWAQAMF